MQKDCMMFCNDGIRISIVGYCSFGSHIIAKDQGNHIESRYDTTVKGCKKACRQTSGCRSFTYCSSESSCHLKDMIIDESNTDVYEEESCSTYFECGKYNQLVL